MHKINGYTTSTTDFQTGILCYLLYCCFFKIQFKNMHINSLILHSSERVIYRQTYTDMLEIELKLQQQGTR